MNTRNLRIVRASHEAGDERPYRVMCAKFDGSRRLFQAYATRHEADAVCRMLRQVGCAAEVESDIA